MTTSLQVSCVQLHWAKPLEFNLARTLHFIEAAARAGSRVVLFPEAGLTSYYFPFVTQLDPAQVQDALAQVGAAARAHRLWVIAGTLRKTPDRFLNLAHVFNPRGEIVYEYAKVHLAGRDEKEYCRGGDKLALFEIDGVKCTLVICRDGRHPELYRIPAMAGAQILFHPSCSSDEIEAVCWKRTSGRAQQPVGRALRARPGPDAKFCPRAERTAHHLFSHRAAKLASTLWFRLRTCIPCRSLNASRTCSRPRCRAGFPDRRPGCGRSGSRR